MAVFYIGERVRYGVRRPFIRGVKLDWHYPMHGVEWLSNG